MVHRTCSLSLSGSVLAVERVSEVSSVCTPCASRRHCCRIPGASAAPRPTPTPPHSHRGHSTVPCARHHHAEVLLVQPAAAGELSLHLHPIMSRRPCATAELQAAAPPRRRQHVGDRVAAPAGRHHQSLCWRPRPSTSRPPQLGDQAHPCGARGLCDHVPTCSLPGGGRHTIIHMLRSFANIQQCQSSPIVQCPQYGLHDDGY